MKLSTIIGLITIAIGVYGALFSYSFFFGFVTVGLFLIIYELTLKKDGPTVQPQYIPSQRIDSTVASFCPKCGTRIAQGITHCPQCGDKVRES